ncbi:PAS domain S-box-containing protein [Geoalkalibacter ferrihydriticus]|uniref:histidine kinase n=1 Tax=Geoalkalibacter ferrihydriticus TaxID=392333 RepID=A0A1G9WW22_9BACT|nr:PAS domain-containing sensor histidine kinase [Geoalkalibacter ferrihydriticus]SDM88629.1 PAS domain S-box-containing protein [Geoalkalibacter ferrihydriticus]
MSLFRNVIILVFMLGLLVPGSAFSLDAPAFGYEMFERHGAVMLLIDPDSGRIVDANQAAVDYYGYPRDQLRRLAIQQINTLSDAETRQERALAARENRNYFIFRHRLANGEIRPVEVYSWPITVNQRTVLFSIIHDVSQRETLQEALVQSEVRLRFAEKVAGVGHWTLDLDTGIYTFSRGARELLGLEGETHEVKSILGQILPEYRELMERSRHRLIEQGEEYSVEIRFQRPGDGRILDLHSQGIYDAEEHRVFGVIHDITNYSETMRTLKGQTLKFVTAMSVAVVVLLAVIFLLIQAMRTRKNAQQALLDREALLKRNDQLLRAKNAELERFTYAVSHDLKSPLVTIQTFLEFLREDMKTADATRTAKDIGYIDSAVQRMTLLLDELREFSRVGRMMNEAVAVSFTDLTEEALALVAGPIAERGVSVQVEDVDLRLVGDRPRLVAVWQNLVENAVKYRGDQKQPRIEVGAELSGDTPVFFVRDNGMGIAPENHDKIFELFKRVETSGDGTGFGLALVKRIVELHGGRIWVESEGEGQGACFSFTLPKAVSEKSSA